MKLLSLSEIEEVLNVHASRIPAVVEDGATLRRIKPYKHESDSNGCNWNVSIVSDVDYAVEISALVMKLRIEYCAQ